MPLKPSKFPLLYVMSTSAHFAGLVDNVCKVFSRIWGKTLYMLVSLIINTQYFKKQLLLFLLITWRTGKLIPVINNSYQVKSDGEYPYTLCAQRQTLLGSHVYPSQNLPLPLLTKTFTFV